MLFVPSLAGVRKAIQTLCENRADPDPVRDKEEFDAAWAGPHNLQPGSDEFLNGQQPHQLAIMRRLEIDLARSGKGLDAIANEATGYQNTFALLLVAVGLLVGSNVAALRSAGIWVWLPGAILFFMLRSHASPMSSWFNNYEGVGERAGRADSTYALANSIRKDVLRYNRRFQRKVRMLALVNVLFNLGILVVCMIVTLHVTHVWR